MILERLESRRLLDAVLVNGTLIVEGTDADDHILFDSIPTTTTGNSTGFNLQVTLNFRSAEFFFDDVRQIEVYGFGGNDRIQLPPSFTVHVWHPLNSDVRDDTTRSYPALLEGSAGNDTIFGGNADDTLVGGRGNDYLAGRGGDDHLSGGIGHDRLYGQDGDDLLEGNDGHDRLNGGAGSDQLLGGGGRDRAHADRDDSVIAELPESA